MNFFQKIIIAFLLLIFSVHTHAQKVGLVLSGGGPKGLAHIGVIRALEEQGIPIDYIAGTSMGAIVGGLYAAGYTPDEMEQIFMSPDFETWITGKIDPRTTYYFRKPEDNPAWVSLDLDMKSGIKPHLPTNIVSPIVMDYTFMKMFSGANAAAKGNFDSLFVPFRCTGSDVQRGRTTYFKGGNLGSAIRASMTFPLFFSPVVIDSIVYFDGGIYDNFPINEMRNEFNPDIIIGSNVCLVYKKKVQHDQLMSFVELLVMKENEENKHCNNCIFIEPKVADVKVTDFAKAGVFLHNGYLATMDKMPDIKAKIKRLTTQEDVEKKREMFKEKIPGLVFDTLILENLNKYQQQFVMKTLANIDDSITFDDAQPYYNRIASDPKISYSHPWAVYDTAKDAFALHLRLEEAKNFSLDIGGNISSSTASELFLQLNYSYFRHNIYKTYINAYAGRFYNSASYRAIVFYPRKLPFFIDGGVTFNGWDYLKTSSFFYQEDVPVYLKEKETDFELNVGMPVGLMFKTSVGYAYAMEKDEYYISSFFTKQDTADVTKFHPHVFKFNYEGSTLNHKQYANRGMKLHIDARFVTGQSRTDIGSANFVEKDTSSYLNYFSAEILYQKYFKIAKRYTFGFLANACYSSQPLMHNYTLTILNAPAFYPTIESMTIFLPQFRAHQYAAFGVQNVFTFWKKLDVRAEAYIFQPYKAIKNDIYQPYYGDAFADRSFAGSLGAVYHTPIGPVSFAINKYDNWGDWTDLNFSFNIGYTLFNNRAIRNSH